MLGARFRAFAAVARTGSFSRAAFTLDLELRPARVRSSTFRAGARAG
ncbi:MAG TPA: hypothetical protein VFL41_01330 [Gaiellaceae bacterium]|nr:hypothetical protein [Gaiellaceae bacterium]